MGDSEFYKTNDCPVLRPIQEEGNVPIFISLGYTNKGVNYVNLVFAPSYDVDDPDKEVDLKIGQISTDMEFVNLAFSQQNAFMGFTGITS